MNVSDGRGQNKVTDKENNRKKVKDWLINNPGKTISECCNGTGLSYKTVRNHIDHIIKTEE